MRFFKRKGNISRKRLFLGIFLIALFGAGASVWGATTIQMTLRRSGSLDSGLVAHYTLDGPETDISPAGGGDWTQETASADWSARARTQKILSYDGKLWLMGGWSGSEQLYDVWSSEDGENWTLVTNSPAWSGTGGATKEALVFDGRMWIVGGGNTQVWYSYDGASWTLATSDAGWNGGGGFRNQHAVTVHDGRMWMTGGTNGSDQRDVWYSYDGANWTQATATANWSARQNHQVVSYDGRLWVVGGGGGGGTQVWSSVDGVSWTQVTSNMGLGGQLGSHRMTVYDDKMWIIGGFINGNPTSGVWWSEDGANWTQATASPGFAARAEHGVTVHNGRMWVVGGISGATVFRDVWSTSVPTTSQIDDSSGNDNHGVYIGSSGQKYTMGRVGQALEFDGEEDRIDIGTTGETARTVSFWVKPESTGTAVSLSSSARIDIGGSFPQGIRFLGGASGTTSATLPPHQAGDLLLAFAYRDGSTTSPSLPSGWSSIAANGGNTNSSRLAYRIAPGSGTSSGTWTNATSTVFHVYRGVNQSTPIGANGSGGSTSATVTYPGLSMQITNGTSWVAGFAGHRSTNTSLETPPSGMVNRVNVLDGTDEASGHDTNGGVSSWSATGVAVGGTSSGWRARTVEIRQESLAQSASVSTVGISGATVYVNGSSGSTLEPGAWNHVVVTSSSAISVSDLVLASGAGGSLKGALDDVRLYSGALTSGEIDRIYHLGATTVINRTPNATGLDDGLVLHHTFDAPEVASSTSFSDRSGNGRTLTFSSPTTVGIGRLGSGLRLSGTQLEYATVAHHSSIIPGSGSFSYGLWVHPEVNVGEWDMPLYKGGASAGDAGYGIELGTQVWGTGISDGSTNRDAFFNPGGWDNGTYLSPGSWYHLMAVIDRSNNQFRTYVNGELMDTVSITGMGSIGTTNPLTFGHRPTPNSGWDDVYRGMIDDVRIYNRAISQDEITRLYNLGTKSAVVGVDTTTNQAGNELNSGLLARWTFDGKDMVGTSTMVDIVNGNNATMANGAAVAPGKIGQGLSFPGRATVSSSSNINPTSTVTYSAWIRWNGSNGQSTQFQNIITNGATTKAFRITESGNPLQTDRLVLQLNIGGNTVTTSSIGLVPKNEWAHVAATYNGSQVVLYIDGEIVATNSASGSIASATGATHIGAHGTSANQSSFSGRMDDVRIYSRALSQTEIQRLYQFGGASSSGPGETPEPPNYDITSDLGALWTFDSAHTTSTTASDTSTNTNHATITGTSSTSGVVGDGARYFNGSTAGTVSGHSSINPTSELTYAAWVNWGGDTDETYSLQSILTNGAWNKSLRITEPGYWNGANQVLLMANIGGTNQEIYSGTQITVGNWHHVAATYDGSEVCIYIDGVEANCDPYTGAVSSSTSTTYIATEGGGAEYTGALDDVRIYTRALTPADIQALYALGSP